MLYEPAGLIHDRLSRPVARSQLLMVRRPFTLRLLPPVKSIAAFPEQATRYTLKSGWMIATITARPPFPHCPLRVLCSDRLGFHFTRARQSEVYLQTQDEMK